MADHNLWKTTELIPLLKSRGINLSNAQGASSGDRHDLDSTFTPFDVRTRRHCAKHNTRTPFCDSHHAGLVLPQVASFQRVTGPVWGFCTAAIGSILRGCVCR